MHKFEGKVALITGGTSGIGRATAVAFAQLGATVVVTGRRVEEGEESIRLVKEVGDGIFIQTDVSDKRDITTLFNKIIEKYGHLDYAFNNAAIMGTPGEFTTQTEEDFDNVIAINVKGLWLCMKYEIQQMLKQGGGAIVNTSSVSGLVGSPNSSIYAASKHAVLGLTKSAALEFAKQGIRINAVSPGAIETDMMNLATGGTKEANAKLAAMQPIGRVGNVKEIADAVMFLCSDASSFIVGQSLTVDGGYTAQ